MINYSSLRVIMTFYIVFKELLYIRSYKTFSKHNRLWPNPVHTLTSKAGCVQIQINSVIDVVL